MSCRLLRKPVEKVYNFNSFRHVTYKDTFSSKFAHTDCRPALSGTSKHIMPNLAQDFQGPSLTGLSMNIFLHGLSTAQMYLYFVSFKKDRLWLKLLVVALYSLDTFHTVSTFFFIYDTIINNFSNEANLLRGSWVLSAGANLFLIFLRPQLNKDFRNLQLQLRRASSVWLYNHFFAWRVYVLTKNVIIVATIILFSIASLAGSLSSAVSLAIHPNDFLVADLQIEVSLWLAGAVLADTIIATSLVWHLRRHKHLYPALTSVINRILRMTVQTGLLTTIFAIINLGCYMANSMGNYAIFSMILSKLYTNCMLSTLNARKAWKYDGMSEDEINHVRGDDPAVVVFQTQRTQPEVFVQVESHQMSDMDDKPSRDMQYV
ncbi:hypothetical protein EDC04DRAFT_3139575 [Pisolithus marmoratus]|nr:hypothetical protein EDC04DRAFT_3139575 [Pisolithus marmoratus]